MIHTIFKDKDWEIIGHNYEFELKYPYYIQHANCVTWIHSGQIICKNCKDTVPDSVQTLITLLTWGS
ncbi:hypothetical protein LCGC14_2666990 [marine sediment metagenome]|uniref:Uncharacterized protein n=1 Tax=marine sediment metagenome TaxID=412755 RepID=A0A0F8ZQ71_9ZZZZ